jgi:hypothetical protein
MTQDQFHTEEVKLDPGMDKTVQKQAIKEEARSAARGLVVGLIVIVLGALLTWAGVTGLVDLQLEGLGLNARVANAGPGVVAMLIGLFIIWRTSFRVKATKGK